MDNLLTIQNNKSIKTLRISQWLHEDPVSLDKTRRKHNLKIHNTIFDILISKLRANHTEYFREAIGLNMRIEFKGYVGTVQAIVPYKDEPVEFYKWWCLNQNAVKMTFAEKIALFDRVYLANKRALTVKHKQLINKK